MKTKLIFGFTLAETLITLGIIGIVAALTIPSLVAKYQKMVLASQLKKSYTQIQQGFQRMLAVENVENLEDTQAWQAIEGHGCGSSYPQSCQQFFNKLKQYIDITKMYKEYIYYDFGYNSPDGMDSSNYVFSDGSLLLNWFYFYSSSNKTNCGNDCKYSKQAGFIFLDVNGYKKPNMKGKDIFSFDISSDGRLIPSGSLESAEAWSMDLYWQNGNCGISGQKLDKVPSFNEGGGEYCVGRIMEENWTITYY